MGYINKKNLSMQIKNIFNFRLLLNTIIISMIMIYNLGFRSKLTVSLEVGVLIFILFLIQPIRGKIQLMFYLLPFQSSMVINQKISLLVVLQAVLVLSLLAKNKSVRKDQFLILLGFLVLQLFSGFLYGASIINITSIVLTFAVSILLNDYFYNSKIDMYPLLASSLVIGITIASFIAIFPKLNILIMGRSIGRFYGLWTNPNILGMQLLVAMSLIITMIFERNISKIKGIILLVIFGFFVTLTSSRSAIFALSLLILVALIMKLKNEKSLTGYNKIFKSIFVILFFAIVTFLVYSFVMEPIIINRGIVSLGSDFSSGRITLLKNNYRWILEEKNGIPLLVGIGIDNNLNYMKQNGFATAGTHNTYAEMLLSSGIFGFTLWVLLFKSIIGIRIKPFFEYRKLFIYVIFLYTFTAHLNTSSFMYISLTLIACSRVNRYSVSIFNH